MGLAVLSEAAYSARYSGSYQDYIYKKSLSPVISKLLDLYVSQSYKWVEQLKNGVFYTLNLASSYSNVPTFDEKFFKRSYPLKEQDIFLHLDQYKSIAVFPSKTTSKFLIFDVDTLDYFVVKELVRVLSCYFNLKYINIHFSGNKGYHVSIFFSELVSRKYLQNLFDHIISELVLSDKDKQVIECRGGISENAVKIPLGYNYSNYKYGETYYVDMNGTRVRDSHQYLLNIEKISSSELFDILEINNILIKKSFNKNRKNQEILKYYPVVEKKVLTFNSTQIDIVEKRKEEGITEKGMRHKTMFLIAISLRDAGYSQEEAVTYLFDWHSRLDKSFYSSSERVITKDINNTVRDVYKNLKYKLKKKNNILFSKAELEEIMSVEDLKLRKVYFVMFCHMKSLGLCSTFFMTYSQMAACNLTDNRSRLKEQIEKLQELGKITVVSSNKLKPRELKKNLNDVTEIKLPNLYKLNVFESMSINDENFSYKLNLEGINDDTMNIVAKKVFISEELMKFYKKSQLSRLKKLDENNVELDKIVKDVPTVRVNVLTKNEINSVRDSTLKTIYALLIVNAIGGAGVASSKNVYNYTGYAKYSDDSDIKCFIEHLAKLEELGKIRIVKREKFFFLYELVNFKLFSVDTRQYLEKLIE